MDKNKEYLNDLKAELTAYGEKLSKIQSQFKGNVAPEGKKVINSLQKVLDEATNSYSQLKDASEKEWAPLKKISTQAFEDLKGSFNEFLNSSAAKGAEYKDQIGSYSEEQEERVSEYIGQNPLKSILIALAAGFVIGKITK